MFDCVCPFLQLSDGANLFIFGDLHGDVENFVHSLKTLGLADVTLKQTGVGVGGQKWEDFSEEDLSKSVQWTGRCATVVSVGDLFDRGPYGKIIFQIFEELNSQAQKEGGKVVNLIGNHELMLLQGKFQYAKNELARYPDSGQEKWKKDWKEGYFRKQIAARYNVMYLHEDSLGLKRLFVHGGLSTAFVNQIDNMAEPVQSINQQMRQILTTTAGYLPKIPNPQHWQDYLTGGTDGGGPMWDRVWQSDHLCNGTQDGSELAIGVKLKKFGASQLIVGHSPMNKDVVQRCDGQVVNIDTTSSRFMLAESNVYMSLKLASKEYMQSNEDFIKLGRQGWLTAHMKEMEINVNRGSSREKNGLRRRAWHVGSPHMMYYPGCVSTLFIDTKGSLSVFKIMAPKDDGIDTNLTVVQENQIPQATKQAKKTKMQYDILDDDTANGSAGEEKKKKLIKT